MRVSVTGHRVVVTRPAEQPQRPGRRVRKSAVDWAVDGASVPASVRSAFSPHEVAEIESQLRDALLGDLHPTGAPVEAQETVPAQPCSMNAFFQTLHRLIRLGELPDEVVTTVAIHHRLLQDSLACRAAGRSVARLSYDELFAPIYIIDDEVP